MGASASVRQSTPDPTDPSLLTFGLLILASVAWVVLVVLLLPRFLGRVLSFLANRASRGSFHVVIPSLHIYPLAGRAVAHSVRYTVPDGTVSVEELVLQVRWWRRAPESQFRQLLAVDDAQTLDPVVHAQQQLERENNAAIVKRFFYKLRRWWTRNAVTTDALQSKEPPPLISLICVGLRARLVNVQANYEHVNRVLNLAKASSRGGSTGDAAFDVPPADNSTEDLSQVRADPDASSCSSTSSSSYSSVQSVEAKPFMQRVLELVSLRITSGAFYLCDMGQSPLVCVVVNSAKVRYRYGAPACPIDECRKRFRVRLSGLQLSVADRDTVRAIVDPHASAREAPVQDDAVQDNTDRMIRRVMAAGYLGMNEPFLPAKASPTKKRPRTSGKSSSSDSRQLPMDLRERRQGFRYGSRAERREARRKRSLPCADILLSETTVIDYVFDEPGPIVRPQSSKRRSQRAVETSCEGTTEDSVPTPAPICRVSIVLRGASFSYNSKAIADVERVIERLQPAFYDLMPLAMKAQSRDGKRSATGIQIEIDATPAMSSPSRSGDSFEDPAFISVPFVPRSTTWKALTTFNVRNWHKHATREGASSGTKANSPPPSAVQIHATHVSIRTEVPYRIGAQQKTIVVGKEVSSRTTGVVEMPFCKAGTLTVVRTMQLPQVWNDVHVSSVDVFLKESEFTYLPDTTRVIDDLSTTFAQNSKKPRDVRYFIPMKETTRIRAENNYTVIMACSHDNAWENILSGQADRYGRIKVCGKAGELMLSPNVPTEYFPDSNVVTWTLSLPSAVGKLELPMPCRSATGQVRGGGSTTHGASDSDRSLHHKGRPPSLAQRVRSQLSIHHHHEHSTSEKTPAESITVRILQAGKVCNLTGKVLVNDNRPFLGSNFPAFLDSVNRSDVSFKASSLSLDVNPHHVSHFLSLTRNYAGTGTHTISTEERTRLHIARNRLAGTILDERRYPSPDECIVLGLGAGQALLQEGCRTAMDELFRLSLQIDSVVLRLHKLPHALCPFSEGSDTVCSVESERIVGSIRSNRLGSELTFAPELKKNRLTLHCEYRGEDKTNLETPERDNLSSPIVVIDKCEIRKRTKSGPDWGPYHSALEITIGEVSGCVMDESIVWLSQIAMAALPEPLSENQMAVAALLSVENIDVVLGGVDLLILSTCSNASAERSGQLSKMYMLRKEEKRGMRASSSAMSTFLTGVTQFRVPSGLRFCMSNLASETTASRSRLTIPDISVDVLMSWGGKLTTWVDDATLRAQVAHAILARKGSSQGSFHDIGLMRRAAEVRKATLEVVFDSRPRIWSQHVADQQKHHISQMAENVRGHLPAWCLPPSAFPKEETHVLSTPEELNLWWWAFLRRSRRASILSKHIAKNAKRQGKLESISIALVSIAAIVLSPESLELANDIVIRCKERISGQELTSPQRDHPSEENCCPEAMSSADVTAVWDAYETARAPQWTTPGEGTPGVSLRGFETKSFNVLLLSPMLPGEIRRNDELFRPESMGDVVHISFPLGIHFVEVGNTVFPAATEEDEHVRKPPLSHVIHIRDLHSSIPSFSIGCGKDDICNISGAVLIFREKSTIRNAIYPPEQRVGIVREDKRTLIVKISSVGIGERGSSLHLYACFGRIAAVFMLMSRALALEYSSLSSLRDHRLSSLCKSIFHVSPHELELLSPRYVRGFLSEVSKIVRDQTDSGKRRTVAFSEDLPLFVRDYAVALVGQMKRNIVSSVDVAVRDISLQVAFEDILTADTFLCKGGSTAQAQASSVLEGHVLNASFGTISVSILDDVAANTLRMVSEVASFVRRATFSVPMLRYDGLANSQLPMSSDLFSFSYTNANFVKAKSRPVEPVRLSQEHNFKQPFPTLSHGLHGQVRTRRSNIPRATLRGPGAGSFRAHRNSVGNSSNTGSWKYSGLLSSNSRDSFPRAVCHRSPWDERSGFVRSEAEGNSALRDMAPGNTAQPRSAVDRRRSRPLSLAIVDHRPHHRRQALPSTDTFEEDNNYYAYVAIPTAGESGPPRKRAKSRVRVSPVVPPAFSDFEQFSVQEDRTQNKMLFSHRNQSGETNADSRHAERPLNEGIGEDAHQVRAEDITSTNASNGRGPVPTKPLLLKNRQPLTVFGSCTEIVTRYFRRNSPANIQKPNERKEAEICCSIGEPRLSLMSAPSKGSYSLVVTASSATLTSANNPNCVLTGSISNMGVTISVAQSFSSSTLPKLIASARVSEFKTTLHAKDLISVLKFREEFKSDMKAVVSAFITTKSSITEMTRATRLSSSKVLSPGRSLFSTMAFDLLFEQSRASLKGFHPKDSAMCMTYFLDGMFFSVVASEDDSAALTLGLRLYGHRLLLFAPSWPSEEIFHFPSLDARGVQWGESTRLPTLLKVSAEPLVNCTSIQGLRHVLFTVAGLMAFQNTIFPRAPELHEQLLAKSISSAGPESKDVYADPLGPSHTTGATPFTRSFAAWERTKGIRMDLSIRPMSISLASGQVVALFELEAITGIFEWNKLVVTGVQLHTAVNIPRISLMFMRMPTAEFSFSDIRLDEHRASMSVALERSRIDVLKTQDDLTHTYIFRVDVFAVSGQLRPWRLLMDAAVWADEQEFVSDLQSINYTALSSRPRTLKSPRPLEPANPLEHRVVLIGFNIQRFKLAVPLLSSEEYSSSRLALRATELHLLARRRFDSLLTPRKNILEVKTHFIGILWENTALLSTHHSRITLRIERPSSDSDAHFGAVNVVMVAGTWRVCPRKDVVMAILEAKNGKDNRSTTEKSQDVRGALPDMLSRGSNVVGDSGSNTTERHGRLLVESLRFKILRTSGFIEGLEGGVPLYQSSTAGQGSGPHRTRTVETSKLSVPAFSIAMVRDKSNDFDVIDIDFSGREGEFPRGCLQKVSNLFAELFGAVASDQQAHLNDVPVNPVRQSREISRDVSVLIRFGKSLYRAQEEANASVESKFCFFAGRTSTILASLSTKAIFEDESSHSTVISGISPKLALEITPLIEGAKVQSLRLIDARFLHAISPCHPPHTIFHVVKVTALLDTKTLLLTQGRLKAQKTGNSVHVGSGAHAVPPERIAERNVMLVLGRSRKATRPASDSVSGQSSGIRAEPDIRLQVKLPLKNESPTNQIDLFVGRLHTGICRTRKNPYLLEIPLNVHVALHEVNLRGQWEILSCKLRLRENLFNCTTSGLSPRNAGLTVITNIMNRLQFECMQYGNHTMKLAVDAVAAIWSVPKRDVLIESTEITTEVSHTMIKAIVRLMGQVKKLRSEVDLLMEREMSKDTKRNTLSQLYTYDGRSADSLLSGQESNVARDKETALEGHIRSASVSSEHSDVPTKMGTLKRSGKKTKVYIKGDGLNATMRGYQFEETQHSAVLALVSYEVSYEYDFTPTPEPTHIKRLGIDFANMKMAYNDDERGIHSDLFKVPSPNLRLKVVDTDTGLTVELLGDLEIKLGHGFYYWQDFKKLSELTIQGIMPTLDPNETVSVAPPDRPEVWDGRVAQVSVRLNPRIDVIGDLTSDMLQVMERRRGQVDIVPKHLYDYIVVPLETLSETLCDALLK